MLPEAVRNLHFVGVGGYGMSPLALILFKMGYRVSGSDLKETEITRCLARQGVIISYRHQADHVLGADLVVYSTAIPRENPELVESRRRGIQLWHRSELLAALMKERFAIAVAGTHGKTTTTALISLILEKGGLDPTAVAGGLISSFEGNARLGKSRYLVAEACESDNSFLRYTPQLALVTNIEADHLEHYEGDFSRLQEAYRAFLNNTAKDGCAVLCIDDPCLREICSGLQRKVVTYALENRSADFFAAEISPSGFGSQFVLYQKGKPVAGVSLRIPGLHNICNAVGALAVAAELELDLEQCAKALPEFGGAGRRFEIVGVINGITIIDDYAHHPTEVRVTIQAARSCGKRVLCIFQPHRYTRTAYFMDEFARSFSEADLVLLHRIYPAGEQPIEGISSEALARLVEQAGKGPVHVSESMDELAEHALKAARPGDNILVMGAGDIGKLAYSLRDRLAAT